MSEPSTSARSYWQQTPKHLSDDWRIVLLLAVILLVVYLPGLGSYGLYDPWETHYGEVARTMVENDNYIDPWWGSPWDTEGVRREREGFYSKPPMIMWMMAGGLQLVGYKALGFRFFFPLAAVLALVSVYLAVSRLFSRRAGLLATLVTATVPFMVATSRQAVPDGVLVAIVTAGMMSLAYGLFGAKDDERASPLLYGFVLGLAILVMVGQLWVMLPMDRSPDVVRAYMGERGIFFKIQWWFQEVFLVAKGKGWILALILAPFAAWAGLRIAREHRRKMLYVYLFYIACGLIVPTKGWLGWAPMGGAILGYMLISGDWKILTKVDIPGGLLIVFMTGHPWVIAMLGGHHPGWYKRFWVHDHINRLFAGVHSLDNGGFEYFVRWLGYGLFPWVGLVPAAFIRIFGRLRKPAGESWTKQQRFEIFVLCWALFSFFLFSKSSTKFHHYILPAVPAITILLGLCLDDLFSAKAPAKLLTLCSGAIGLFCIGEDLYRMPLVYGQGSQNIVNMFTYKYDREWPKFLDETALSKLKGSELMDAIASNEWLQDLAFPLICIAIAAAVGLTIAAFSKRNYIVSAVGCVVLSLSGLSTAVYVLQKYLPDVSVHWSQEEMWNAYYDQCTKFAPEEVEDFKRQLLLVSERIPSKLETFPKAWCKEPIVAFRTNWRGETVYSANTVIPAPETKNLATFLDVWPDKPFYLFTERSRVRSELDPHLPASLKDRYEEVFGKNLKFVLLRIDPKLEPKNKNAKDSDASQPSEDPTPANL